MSIWQAIDGSLHDDSDGAALGLKNWPQGMTLLTDAQVQVILSAQAAALSAAQAKLPNPSEFIAAVKTVLGGYPAILSLPAEIQSALAHAVAAINMNDTSSLQAIITSQESALNAVNIGFYSGIKAAAIQYNINITLP